MGQASVTLGEEEFIGYSVYPSYFGYDEKGKIVKIVTDFQLF